MCRRRDAYVQSAVHLSSPTPLPNRCPALSPRRAPRASHHHRQEPLISGTLGSKTLDHAALIRWVEIDRARRTAGRPRPPEVRRQPSPDDRPDDDGELERSPGRPAGIAVTHWTNTIFIGFGRCTWCPIRDPGLNHFVYILQLLAAILSGVPVGRRFLRRTALAFVRSWAALRNPQYGRG